MCGTTFESDEELEAFRTLARIARDKEDRVSAEELARRTAKPKIAVCYDGDRGQVTHVVTSDPDFVGIEVSCIDFCPQPDNDIETLHIPGTGDVSVSVHTERVELAKFNIPR